MYLPVSDCIHQPVTGFVWICLDLPGFAWICLGLPGFAWIGLDLPVFARSWQIQANQGKSSNRLVAKGEYRWIQVNKDGCM